MSDNQNDSTTQEVDLIIADGLTMVPSVLSDGSPAITFVFNRGGVRFTPVILVGGIESLGKVTEETLKQVSEQQQAVLARLLGQSEQSEVGS